MSFEKNMARIDEILSKLSDGNTDLDSSVKLYNEGMNILSENKKLLDDAQLKIKINGESND